MESCDHGSLCLAHLLVFSTPHTTIMVWSHPYLAILTSAGTHYKEAKANDVKAKILAATVNKIMVKAQEDSHPLPDDLKKVCLHPCVCLHIQLTGSTTQTRHLAPSKPSHPQQMLPKHHSHMDATDTTRYIV